MKRYALLTVVVVLLASAGGASAAVLGSYVADGDTLHLYHFDEPSGTTGFDAAGSSDLAIQGGTVNAGALPGFGASLDLGAVSSTNRAIHTTSTLQSTWQGANGSFTYEALVKLDSITGTFDQQIISRDAGGSTSAPRAFQFRVGKNGVIDFIKIRPGTNSVSAAVPTTGADRFIAGAWYHVAVSYNGAENTADNTVLYWTRVRDSAIVANAIGSGNLPTDVDPSVDYSTTVGNRHTTATENVRGRIDEVRVSGIGRTPTQFVFGAPQGLQLSDSFNVLADAADANPNVANDRVDRQVGPVVGGSGVGWSGGGTIDVDPTFGSVLSIPGARSNSVVASPDHNFAFAQGGRLVVEFDFDAIVGGGGTNTNWLAINLFKTDAGRTPGGGSVQLTSSSTPFGILLRDNGGYQAFSNGALIAEGAFTGDPDGWHFLRMTVDLEAFANGGEATINAYMDGSSTAFMTQTIVGNLATNFMSLESRGGLSHVDNFTVSFITAVPEPGTLMLMGMLLGIVARRRNAIA